MTNYRVDLGQLLLVGISPLHQSRTCVSGQTCAFGGIVGQDLSSANRFLVLDTCAEIGVKLEYGVIPRFSTFGSVVMVTSSGQEISWGSVRITAAGGQYQLCWCEGLHFSCKTSEEFQTNVGGFTLVGISPLSQHRTCVSGHSCIVSSFDGQHLTHLDAVVILDTCGTRAGMFPAKLGEGMFRFQEDGWIGHMSTGTSTVRWGTSQISAPGGQYRLCWCSGASDLLIENRSMNSTETMPLSFHCSVAESMRVDFGELDLIGVYPLEQHRTCISGQPCDFGHITGHHLSSLDRFWVLDTCGTEATIPRFLDADYSTVAVGDTLKASWGTVEITAQGGQYRLCWCAGLPPPLCHRM